MSASTQTLTRWLTVWAVVGFLVRAVVPSGFMVATPIDGWPVVPCPGQEHGVLQAALANNGHRDHSKHSEGCDTDCYLGFFFSFAAELGAEVTMSSSLVDAGPLPDEPRSTLATTSGSDVRPRAPPLPA